MAIIQCINKICDTLIKFIHQCKLHINKSTRVFWPQNFSSTLKSPRASHISSGKYIVWYTPKEQACINAFSDMLDMLVLISY